MSWLDQYKEKRTDAHSALKAIKPGYQVFLNANCGEPATLVEALEESAANLDNVKIVQLLAMGDSAYVREELARNLRYNALFIGPAVRKAVNAGLADYTPVFLSEIPALFKNGLLPIDVALIQVSPPDEHGFCSFGISVDIGKPAAESAKIVIAEVNQQMPRTLGDCFIHASKLTYIVETDRPIRELPPVPFTEVHERIGAFCAELIEDGSTLQLGIGAIPNAVLAALKDHRRIGVHTEMFSDGVMDAFQNGVITNEEKSLHPGKLISSFIMGSRKLYDFVDNNPCVEMHPSDYTNDPFIIAQNNKMVAVNSAISVDLTGQVNADSIGMRLYSGIGGQVDYIRGAARAEGGKAIIAMPSMARDNSRIVPTLAAGAGVVTSRGDVHYMVTEYGVAYLHGKSIRERCKELIRIAHPESREDLAKFARDNHYVGAYELRD
jgi:4-hydroxybutyrate CoA-transferase